MCGHSFVTHGLLYKNLTFLSTRFLDPIPYEEYQGMKTTEIAEMVKKRIEAVVTA